MSLARSYGTHARLRLEVWWIGCLRLTVDLWSGGFLTCTYYLYNCGSKRTWPGQQENCVALMMIFFSPTLLLVLFRFDVIIILRAMRIILALALGRMKPSERGLLFLLHIKVLCQHFDTTAPLTTTTIHAAIGIGDSRIIAAKDI
ncbi:hypothetical protein GGR53DRAFT_481150 [Hypoxylon sp. FL1150]|nr:hypothetical protein GGR53DRAFT_481150 [Hypoxylon sp. FL1150]